MAAVEFLPVRDIVGESLVWDAARGALVWVDIGGRRIHRHCLATARHETWPTMTLRSLSNQPPSSAHSPFVIPAIV